MNLITELYSLPKVIRVDSAGSAGTIGQGIATPSPFVTFHHCNTGPASPVFSRHRSLASILSKVKLAVVRLDLMLEQCLGS